MNIKRNLCSAAIVAATVFGASADIPVKLVNNSKGEFADGEVYIAIVGRQGDHSIYYNLAESGAQKRCVVSPLNDGLNRLHVKGDDWGYADIFTRMSDIPQQTFYIGDTYACRMFVAFKSPMYLHAFADGGYAGADMNNPGDPNAPIRWEIIEFTYEPNVYDGQIWINTSRVDAFQYPMGLELYATGNRSGSTPYIKRGEIIDYHAVVDRWNSTYSSSVYKDCYYNLIERDNLGGIIKQPSKVQSIKGAHIFDGYINKVWDFFRTNEADITMGVLGRWKGRVQGDAFVMTCVEGHYWQPGSVATVLKPTTEDAIEGAGTFAQGSDIDKTVQAMFCAAFNRGQFRAQTANQNWDPNAGIRPFQGGSEYPCNEYVKFFHDTAVSASNGYTYAFAYDDTFDQSATCYSTAPTAVTITIGGFAGLEQTQPAQPVQPEPQPSGLGAAPAPAHAAQGVMSFFSDAYPSIAPGMIVGNWGQTTQSETVALDGNKAYKMSNFNYLGLQVSGADETVDLADMEMLHIDLYADADMDLNFYPIALRPTFDTASKRLHIAGGKWNSYDIALSDFPGVDFSRLGQFKMDGGNGQTFYIDNLYTWKKVAVAQGLPAAPAPGRAAADVMSIYSNAYASAAPGLVVGNWGQATQAEAVELRGDAAYKFSDFNYLGLQVSGSDATINASGMEMIHLDLYAEADMDLNFYPIALHPTFDSASKRLHIRGGQWNSYDLALSDFPGVDFSRLGQFKMDGGNGQTFYLDNLYLWKEPIVFVGGIPAAPAPSRAASQMKSFFSDAYGSDTPDLFVGNWGQATGAELISENGQEVYRLTGFNYLGFQFSHSDAVLNTTDMEMLHIDLYAEAPMDINIYPIALHPTFDGARVSRHLDGGCWNSFDIALGEFPGVDFSRLGQFKMDGGNGQTFYLDNLYMWTANGVRRVALAGVEEITVEEAGAAAPAGVYDLTGRRIREDNSTSGLPRGIYIVGGRKVAVK
ncbi:MAG: hypothetical protein K2M06_03800 [Muribaculaceae bacterium]|nr:hypothetical protein [Muribaculaceae bacterium]